LVSDQPAAMDYDTYRKVYFIAMREAGNPVKVVQDLHLCGLFGDEV